MLQAASHVEWAQRTIHAHVERRQVRVTSPTHRSTRWCPRALVPKEETVFVSSNSFDVMGAKAYGFQVAWVNRTQAQDDALGIAPDVVLSRLDELPQAFPPE